MLLKVQMVTKHSSPQQGLPVLCEMTQVCEVYIFVVRELRFHVNLSRESNPNKNKRPLSTTVI